MAAGDTLTVPFCGACGFDANNSLHGDVFCDACGADLTRFGFAGLFPPDDLAAVGGTLEVVFTWTANPDTSDVIYQIDGAAVTLDETVTSPYTVVVTAGQKVDLAVRTVLDGVAGPFSDIVSDSADV